MIRNLAKLSGTALVADAFILVGLVYIASCEVGTIVQKGVAPDVVMFNHDNFPLLIGTAVFAFEGIGLYVFREKAADRSVIPITETMKEPHKFPRALSGVMLFVAILFSAFGVLGYAAYGSEVQTVVLVNLPQDEKFVQGSQFLCTSRQWSNTDAQTPLPSSSRSLSSSSLPFVSWRRASSPASASTTAA
jgi:proton-coupled amino acid transporter